MTLDLRDKLKPIGRLDLLAEINQRVRSYYQVSAGVGAGSAIWHHQTTALFNEGDVFIDQNRLADALNSYHQALAISEKSVGEKRTDLEAQSDLATAHERIGDVAQLQGDLDGSLKNYQTAAEIWKSLMQSSPAGTAWKRARIHNLANIGFLESSKGNQVNALASFDEAMAISRRLNDADLNDRKVQRDLWTIKIRLGESLESQGDLGGALGNYRLSLDIGRALARNSSDMDAKRLLGISLEKIGQIQSGDGLLSAALESFTECSRLREELVSRDPSNAVWQTDLAYSLEDANHSGYGR